MTIVMPTRVQSDYWINVMITFWKDEEEKENVTQEDETEEEENGNLIAEEDFKQEYADNEEELDSNKIKESIDTSNIKSEDAEDLENDEKQDAEKDVDDSRLIKNDIKVEDLEEQNDVDESKEVRESPVLMVTMSIQGLAGYWGRVANSSQRKVCSQEAKRERVCRLKETCHNKWHRRGRHDPATSEPREQVVTNIWARAVSSRREEWKCSYHWEFCWPK